MTAADDAGPVAGQLPLLPASSAELVAEESALVRQLEATRARREVAQGYALDGVTAAAQRRRDSDADLAAAVRTARGLGITWERIARAAGMTRQSAWQRWAEG